MISAKWHYVAHGKANHEYSKKNVSGPLYFEIWRHGMDGNNSCLSPVGLPKCHNYLKVILTQPGS